MAREFVTRARITGAVALCVCSASTASADTVGYRNRTNLDFGHTVSAAIELPPPDMARFPGSWRSWAETSYGLKALTWANGAYEGARRDWLQNRFGQAPVEFQANASRGVYWTGGATGTGDCWLAFRGTDANWETLPGINDLIGDVAVGAPVGWGPKFSAIKQYTNFGRPAGRPELTEANMASLVWDGSLSDAVRYHMIRLHGGAWDAGLEFTNTAVWRDNILPHCLARGRRLHITGHSWGAGPAAVVAHLERLRRWVHGTTGPEIYVWTFNGLAPIDYKRLSWNGRTTLGVDKIRAFATPGDPVSFVVPRAVWEFLPAAASFQTSYMGNTVTITLPADKLRGWLQFIDLFDMRGFSGVNVYGSDRALYWQYRFRWTTADAGGNRVPIRFTAAQEAAMALGEFDPVLVRTTWPSVAKFALPDAPPNCNSQWQDFKWNCTNVVAVDQAYINRARANDIDYLFNLSRAATNLDWIIKHANANYLGGPSIVLGNWAALSTFLRGGRAVMHQHIMQTAIMVMAYNRHISNDWCAGSDLP